jgi:hypothetical protein
MSFFGLPRGRRKAVAQVRLVTDSSFITTRYRDGVSEGTVTYAAGAWTELVSAAQNIQTMNMIEIFCSEGFTSLLGMGALSSEVVLLQVVPGGNGPLMVRIDAGTRISVKPLTSPPKDSEFVINFYE